MKRAMTVLIVDDNPGVRRLLQRALTEVALVVWECGDGADALALYQQHRPDVVLMDIRMPRVDGLTATRQIAAENPFARIVIVTDDDDEGIRQAAREAGACAYVPKQNLTDLAQLVITVAIPENPEKEAE